ncbi:hypothetical protein C8Q74DRAFT_1374158 [Fomes fomentarius]|nr:hypothetical protein C8Q74DRAFT_1374158 [Fomes fomentarius]
MQWMIQSRINSVLFSLIWTYAPILVSVTSFFVYVAQRNELTIGTAFTAIALYQMVRAPLNVIPAWIVQVLQTIPISPKWPSIVSPLTLTRTRWTVEQVSTLKKGKVSPSAETETGLGNINGSFKWNEVEEKKEAPSRDKGKGKAKDLGSGTNGSSEADETATAVDDASVTSANLVSPGDHRFELRDINVMFPEGKLTLVTGPTASGKTALLMALLGELTTLEGRIVMSKNASKVDEHGLALGISYFAQSPWLRHQSIKDNILFGHPYDYDRYDAVLDCCQLDADLEFLEDGDATEIGARVALARAVYAPTKYVLLDDPLSAVDSDTARKLADRLILLNNRTVILVTHHVELILPRAHYMIRMLDGRIDTQGTISDLRASGVIEGIRAYAKSQMLEAEAGDGDAAKSKKKPRKLIEKEHRETGSVKWNIYNTYLKASSYWTWGILFLLIILAQLLGVGEKVWIEIWGEAYGQNASTPTSSPPFSYSYRAYAEQQHVLNDGLSHFLAHKCTPVLALHPAISLAAGLVNIIGVMIQYTGALRASMILSDKLLRTVVRATMRWHDVTPQGRMLNRFSKDIETVDTSLASTLQQVNQSLALFAVSMLTVIFIFPLFIFPAIVLGFFYRRAAIAYLNTGRDIRRMESNTRSPIFANFSKVLEGIVTVRAFSAEARFLDDLYKKVDLTTQMWYTFWMTNRWLLLTFDALGATGILATTLFALSGYVDAGLAGVCDVVHEQCVLGVSLLDGVGARSQSTSTFRRNHQRSSSRTVLRRTGHRRPARTKTMLVVEDLTVKYVPDLPAVLNKVSFSLKANERVGLLGRTGSGKSTLAMSVLRFIDPAGGRILIDGIDISSIGLHDLRRLTFIPQDATLFSGTLRDNLDPFNEHTDAECIDVLQRVHLLTDSQAISQRTSREASRVASHAASIHEAQGESVAAGEGQGEHGRAATIASVSTYPTETEGRTVVTLDTQISPGGTNFSQGQRRLTQIPATPAADLPASVAGRAENEEIKMANKDTHRIPRIQDLLPLPSSSQNIRTLLLRLQRDPLTALQPPGTILQQHHPRQQRTGEQLGGLRVQIFDLLASLEVGLGDFIPGLVYGAEGSGIPSITNSVWDTYVGGIAA